MLHRIGTTEALKAIKSAINIEVYNAVLSLVQILDKAYGAGRDIYRDDGGVVLILDTEEDLQEAKELYSCIGSSQPEHVEVVNSSKGLYVNAMYLLNNEYSVNVITPHDIGHFLLFTNSS